METKFLQLRMEVTVGSRFGDWQVCWLGGWSKHRLYHFVMLVKIPKKAVRGNAERPPNGSPSRSSLESLLWCRLSLLYGPLPLATDLLKRLSGGGQCRLLARKGLPTQNGCVDIARIEFDHAPATAGFLTRDQGGAGSAKGIQHQISALARM